MVLRYEIIMAAALAARLVSSIPFRTSLPLSGLGAAEDSRLLRSRPGPRSGICIAFAAAS